MHVPILAVATAGTLAMQTILPCLAAHTMACSPVAARTSAGQGDFARALMDEMIARGEDARSGNSPDPEVGRYVIVIVKLPSNDPRAIQKGRQDAMKQIGEYLGASVEASTEAGYKEKSGTDGNSESSSFFKDYSAVRVNQTLGAVDMIGLGSQDGRTVAGFILSEGAAKRMQKISEESAAALKAKSDGKPLEVEATGIAMIEGENQAAAQQSALEVAKRSALEMAMGASVIGLSVMDRDDSSETFRQTCFSTTEGSISSFRVISEGAEGRNYVVRISATVQQGKLLESYRSHLRSMGDPVFCIDASGDGNVQLMANAFFEDKGFRIKEGAACTWTIRLKPTLTERPDPQDRTRSGIQCTIAAQLVNVRSGEVSANAGATAKGFSSMNGGPDVQKRKAAEMAFKNMREELHRKIEDSILRLAREGRPVTVEVRGIGSIDGVTTRLTDSLALRPGINDAKVNLRSGGIVVIELKALVASDLVARFVGADACALAPAGATARLIEQEDEKVVIEIGPAKLSAAPEAPVPPGPAPAPAQVAARSEPAKPTAPEDAVALLFEGFPGKFLVAEALAPMRVSGDDAQTVFEVPVRVRLDEARWKDFLAQARKLLDPIAETKGTEAWNARMPGWHRAAGPKAPGGGEPDMVVEARSEYWLDRFVPEGERIDAAFSLRDHPQLAEGFFPPLEVARDRRRVLAVLDSLGGNVLWWQLPDAAFRRIPDASRMPALAVTIRDARGRDLATAFEDWQETVADPRPGIPERVMAEPRDGLGRGVAAAGFGTSQGFGCRFNCICVMSPDGTSPNPGAALVRGDDGTFTRLLLPCAMGNVRTRLAGVAYLAPSVVLPRRFRMPAGLMALPPGAVVVASFPAT